LEALKEKTAGSLLRYQTCPKWVTFALAKSRICNQANNSPTLQFFPLVAGEINSVAITHFWNRAPIKLRKHLENF